MIFELTCAPVSAWLIADLIHKWQVPVAVMSGNQCASACFLLFAAAERRFAAPDALIGVHSVSENGKETLGAMGMTTAFARDAALYNVPPAIIGKMVQTTPGRMEWLTPDDLTSMGVIALPNEEPEHMQEASPPPEVSPRPNDSAPTTTTTTTELNLTGDWSSYGEWIQLYSRTLFSEAIGLGADYKRKFEGARVFKYNNGWYALVIGPYARGTASATRDRLVATRTIPIDSLITDGTKFDRLAWGEMPPQVSGSSESEADQAITAATEFFRASSQSNSAALAFLDRVYPLNTTYFGKRVSKEYVLNEKRVFLERWPERAYALRPGSITTSCDSQYTCAVTGIVDWRAHSSPRNATASGSARFQLTFSKSGQLLSESSEVLTRDNYAGRH